MCADACPKKNESNRQQSLFNVNMLICMTILDFSHWQSKTKEAGKTH